MLAFDKLHVVDLASRLDPLESELVGELHASRHGLVSSLDQGVLGQLGVVAQSDEAVSRNWWQICVFSTYLLVIQHRGVQVSFVVVCVAGVHAEDGALARGPLQITAVPVVLRAV